MVRYMQDADEHFSSVDGERVSGLASMRRAALDFTSDVASGSLAFGTASTVTYPLTTAASVLREGGSLLPLRTATEQVLQLLSCSYCL